MRPPISAEFLQQMFAATPAATRNVYIPILNNIMLKYGITTPTRIAAFIAQIGHESGGLRYYTENLNYSRKALLRVFPKYFNNSNVDAYAKQPIKIANRVYANRMGNSNEASGDGWRYRGHGLIQLTGKNNFKAFAKHLNKSIDETLAYVKTPAGAAEAAGWFWHVNGLNAYADAGDFNGLTKKINGGYNGLAHRQALYEHALKLIKG